MPDERTMRVCDKCKVSDSHAHHVQYVGFQHPITNAPVDLSVTKHIQCCAADGCSICKTDVEFATKASVATAVGDAFTTAMATKSSEHLAALTERHGIKAGA